MRSADAPEARLTQVVRLIAATMVAEVCSVYLMRADGDLELFETEGLRREAIGKTRLAAGRGMVGHVAERGTALRTRDAQGHPAFEYRPETGEERYSSFLGVPIQHAGRVVGVLVVQNVRARDYTDDELEALETVAMGFAEMIGSGILVTPEALAETVRASSRPTRIAGRSLAEGVAVGRAVLQAPRIQVTHTIADDIGEESDRLEAAITDVQSQIDEMLAQPALASGESRAVMEAFRMFAHDPGWQRRMREGVQSGLTAEAAVKRAYDQTRARFREIADPYLRARLADMEDLANRLINRLSAGVGFVGRDLPDEVVLVARDMGPAELLDFDQSRLKAVVLEEGAVGSHMSIVARALDIPVVGGCEGAIDRIDQGDLIIVDGEHGQAFVRPDADVLEAFRDLQAVRQQVRDRQSKLRDMPAITRDGVTIELLCNAGLLLDMRHLEETGADGVGLFRTELHFMVRSRLPRVQEQTRYYSNILDAAGHRPVVFRTLDVGGDKLLPYMKREPEENPALGWRAVRISLDHAGLFRMQLRALLAASTGRELNVMFPMVADVAEFKAARGLLQREIDWATRQGRPLPDRIRVGVMLEVPALVWRLPALLPLVDFVSVGSNDLMQFMYAVDRGSPRVSGRYDPLSPAFLSTLRRICRQCTANSTDFTLCGEMASSPLDAMVLIGLGFRRLSMRPKAIGAVKEMLLSLDVGALSAEIDRLMEFNDSSLRPAFEAWAGEHGVAI
ncbi:MAG: phosphoenolpyruvate--protein phosphotransferase [Pseudomonadota bacterium]|nr:phosphoenolpyruvate--protein phosphotransferase [Pseudomonadota bacterium]